MRTLDTTRRRFVQTVFGTVAVALMGGAVPLSARARSGEVCDLRPRRCPETECGYLYDPAVGVPEMDLPPGIAFADLPDDWECPECGAPKYLW